VHAVDVEETSAMTGATPATAISTDDADGETKCGARCEIAARTAGIVIVTEPETVVGFVELGLGLGASVTDGIPAPPLPPPLHAPSANVMLASNSPRARILTAGPRETPQVPSVALDLRPLR